MKVNKEAIFILLRSPISRAQRTVRRLLDVNQSTQPTVNEKEKIVTDSHIISFLVQGLEKKKARLLC